MKDILEILKNYFPVPIAIAVILLIYLLWGIKNLVERFISLYKEQAQTAKEQVQYFQQRLDSVEKSLGISEKSLGISERSINLADRQVKELEKLRDQDQLELSAAREEVQTVVIFPGTARSCGKSRAERIVVDRICSNEPTKDSTLVNPKPASATRS